MLRFEGQRSKDNDKHVDQACIPVAFTEARDAVLAHANARVSHVSPRMVDLTQRLNSSHSSSPHIPQSTSHKDRMVRRHSIQWPSAIVIDRLPWLLCPATVRGKKLVVYPCVM
jgi:hypothetical protein